MSELYILAVEIFFCITLTIVFIFICGLNLLRGYEYIQVQIRKSLRATLFNKLMKIALITTKFWIPLSGSRSLGGPPKKGVWH